MAKIQSNQLLEIETKVRVGRYLGVVVKADMVAGAGISGGQVALHKVKLTHRLKRGFGTKYTVEPLRRTITQDTNYAFIETL